MNRLFKLAVIVCVSAAVGLAARAQTNVLVWHKHAGTIDAAMRHEPLLPLLKSIAAQSGWHVYVEPGSTLDSSTQFKNRPTGDALKMLLGDLNFALVPETDSPWRLYVFRTTMKNATQPVSVQKPKHVANELMIKVKPGTNVEALAKMLGAKIIGRMDKYGVYLLQFADADATDSGLSQLKLDSEVAAVDYNYYFDQPPAPQSISPASVSSSPLSLQLSPPSSNGKTIIGLIDTGVQSLGADLNQFILPQINVADGTPPDSSMTHGTAMAYTILQSIASASGSSSNPYQIQPVNVYGGSDEQTTSYNVALGIQQAVNSGATILNMSLGSSGDSTVLDSVVAQAAYDGIVMFAAAGNSPMDAPYYPAADSGVVAVTALGQAGQLASYANSWSDPNMIALPGSGVVYYDGVPWVVQGTSTSTAIATGATVGNSFAHGWTLQQTVPAVINHFTVPKQ